MNHICIEISVWDFFAGIAVLALVVIGAARFVSAFREANRRNRKGGEDD